MSDERDNVLQLILARARDTKIGADQLGSFYRSDVQALESEVIRIEKESDARLERIGELEADITERMKISAVPESVLDRFKETLRSRTKQVDGQCVMIRELQAEVECLKDEIERLKKDNERLVDESTDDSIACVQLRRTVEVRHDEMNELRDEIERLKNRTEQQVVLDFEAETKALHIEIKRLRNLNIRTEGFWETERDAWKTEVESLNEQIERRTSEIARLKNEKTRGMSDVVGRQQ